jgi:type VI protein secretion system component Hcp
MADEKQNDVLMYLIAKEGSQPIEAESTSALSGQDARLMQGFVAGRYFSAETFSFSTVLADDEGFGAVESADTRSYSRWRGLKIGQPRPDPPFRAEPEDVSITRMIDSSSPILLKYCLDTQPFSSAVLVKRSRIGTANMLSPILRLEFTTVWIKAVEWEDGDAIKETCKFKFNAVKATYVKRKPDGRVDSLWPCSWTSPLTGKTNG